MPFALARRYASGLLRHVQSCAAYLHLCKENANSLESATFRGTLYEYWAKEALETRLHCCGMKRVGGAGDNGVDLLGQWDLSRFLSPATTAAPLHSLLLRCKPVSTKPGAWELLNTTALVQCKNHKGKIKAATVRELAGVWDYHVGGVPKVERRRTYLFLVSPFPLSKQAQAQVDSSDIPMIHVKLAPMLLGDVTGTDLDYDVENWSRGEFGPVYLNYTARRHLEGLDVEKRASIVVR